MTLPERDGDGYLTAMDDWTPEIGREMARIAMPVGDDEYLTRAGDHIDIHLAEDQTFCRGDEEVARADDLVCLRNRLCSVGQGCNGLGAPDLEDSIHIGKAALEPVSLLPSGLELSNPTHTVVTTSRLKPENQASF